MTRWKPKLTKSAVLEYQKAHPEQKSTEMAKALGCRPEYIRATLGRAGIKLHRSRLDGPSLCGLNQTMPPEHPDFKYIINPLKKSRKLKKKKRIDILPQD